MQIRLSIKQLEKGRGYHEDDFTIEKMPRLIEPIENALHTIKAKVEAIGNQEFCKDLRLFVGGNGNFRKDAFEYYKSSRPPKPLAFMQCYNFFINKYKNITTVCHGEEAEDQVAIEAWKGYKIALKTRDQDAAPCIMARIDKDLAQVPGWAWNYNKREIDPWWISNIAASRAFWFQMLKGDITDDITGLEDVATVTRNRHGIGRQKGCGEKSANLILEGCTKESEYASAVVDAYKDYYGVSWQSKLNENALLLRMRSFKDEMFNCVEHCKRLGIE